MDNSKYNEIVRSWMQTVEENCMQDAELTLKYCNDIIEYGLKIKDDALVSYGYYYCAVEYYILNDGTHFFESVTNALSYLSTLEEYGMMARCYNFLGITATNRGNAVIAADYYQNATEYAFKAGERMFAATIGVNIGALNVICGRYLEAIDVLKPVGDYFTSHTDLPNRQRYLLVWHENMTKAHLLSGNLEAASKHLQHIESECGDLEEHYTMMSVYCIAAMYYHLVGDVKKRDENIARVHKMTDANVPIMDLFHDYYDYCKLLLEIDKKDEFWHLIDIMEATVKSLDFTNLQLRLIALKIKFYRKNHQNAEYLQGAGLYYELSERSEMESQNMMNNVLNLRKRLQKIQQENVILQLKAETDPLTGLANRSRLNDQSEQIFAKCLEEGRSLTVEIFDIDDFKGFNDHYGHQKGDECLVRIAEVLKTMETEHGAFVARYGGDEFILIYEDITWEQAEEYAKELRQKVVDAAIPFPHSSIAEVVTITQGLCWNVPVEQNRMWDYLHAADDMLYRTKKRARNHYSLGDLKETEDKIVSSIPK